MASAPTGRRDSERQRDNSIRVDTARLDQVLNLSGEIGLTKNRLNALRSDILAGRTDTETLQALDDIVQLSVLSAPSTSPSPPPASEPEGPTA